MNYLAAQMDLYVKGDPTLWKGRVDGQEKDWMRWHQLVDCVDLLTEHDLADSVTLLGFCCDEGVRRNQGRTGAKDGPAALRHILANLPVHFSDQLKLKDAGNILLKNNDLESTQLSASSAIATILEGGGFPLVLGGGHEVTYAHYLGIKEFLRPNRGTVGIINLDAHLDMRKPTGGLGNSGTGFYQIAKDLALAGHPFHYLAIGIQEISNTKGLFSYAKSTNTQIIKQNELTSSGLHQIIDKIQAFAQQVDYIYLTIDLDAFAAPYAPGVSSLAFNGIIPDALFFDIYHVLITLPQLKSMDIAELNPCFDSDNRTAKLAADLLFKLMNRT